MMRLRGPGQCSANTRRLSLKNIIASRPVRTCTVACTAMLPVGVPISVLTDSYKATHFLQYPKAQKMVAVSLALTTRPLCRVS